jgi:hypothetical protein
MSASAAAASSGNSSTPATSPPSARIWLYSFENNAETLFRAAGKIASFPASFRELVTLAQAVMRWPGGHDAEGSSKYDLRFFLHPPATMSTQSGIDRSSGAELLEDTFHLLRDNDAVEVMRFFPLASTSGGVVEQRIAAPSASRPTHHRHPAPTPPAVNVLFVTPEAKSSCRPVAAELQACSLAAEFLQVRIRCNQPLQIAFEAFQRSRPASHGARRQHSFLSTHYAIVSWNAFILRLKPTDTIDSLGWKNHSHTMIVLAQPEEDDARRSAVVMMETEDGDD